MTDAVDLRAAVDAHAALFNRAVRSGDHADFIATFAPDAVMRFATIPIGPFRGREAIARAYADQPPTDTITVREVEEYDPQTAHVALDYDNGGSGTMTLRWRDGQVADLTIAFD